MLFDIFKEKRCFKLVCGAGNEDVKEIEKLVALYSAAGCNFFDLSARAQVVQAAKRGLKRAGIEKDRYLCVSVGISNDPHVSKAQIDNNKCQKCGICQNTCPQHAIVFENDDYTVNTTRCIGCGQCINACPAAAISRVNNSKDFSEILPPIIKMGIDAIEFHVLGTDEQEIDERWKELLSLYDGPISINIERSKLGTEGIIARTQRLLKDRKPYTTIIQADGIAMSGGNDTYRATLQAVAMAEMVQSHNLPVYLMVSGGTNSKTTQLAKMCDVDIQGVAIGSFARKIVREYIDREDFLTNEKVFNKAVEIAKKLVDVSLENLK